MNYNLIERMLPSNVKAETFIIGACFSSKASLETVLTTAKQEYFYNLDNQNIMIAIKMLSDSGQQIDYLTVLDQLEKNEVNTIDFKYLSDCFDSILHISNLEKYIQIVKNAYLKRYMINFANDLLQQAYTPDTTPENLFELAETNLFKVTNNNSSSEVKHISELINDNFEEVANAIEQGLEYHNKQLTPTKYPKLDEILNGGFTPSDLIILAARPAMGKTSFVLNLLTNVAKQYTVAFFSLEMSKEQVVDRIISAETNIYMGTVKNKSFTTQEFENFYLPKLPHLKKFNFYIDDSSYTLNAIKSKIRRLKIKHNDLRLVSIDYLQIMDVDDLKNENMNQAFGKITRSLKRLAKELGITIILLSQLSRAVEQRGNKRPMLSDLRDSGSIEQDSDIVLFIYRDDYYNEKSEKKLIADIIFAKHRNGAVGTVELYFNAKLTKFESLETGKI